MKIIDQEGLDFKYELSYRRVGSATWLKRNETNSTTKYTFNPQGTFVQYEACVLAYNRQGPSTARSTCMKGYSWQQSKDYCLYRAGPND